VSRFNFVVASEFTAECYQVESWISDVKEISNVELFENGKAK
jgi:hypothetical protein